MPAFQILDKNNNPIPINKLDEEICQILGIEAHPKRYASFRKREEYSNDMKGEFDYKMQSNWFDTIGYQFSQGMTIEDIIESDKKDFADFIGKVCSDGSIITLEYINPGKMKVLNTWKEKGYKPISVTL